MSFSPAIGRWFGITDTASGADIGAEFVSSAAAEKGCFGAPSAFGAPLPGRILLSRGRRGLFGFSLLAGSLLGAHHPHGLISMRMSCQDRATLYWASLMRLKIALDAVAVITENGFMVSKVHLTHTSVAMPAT